VPGEPDTPEATSEPGSVDEENRQRELRTDQQLNAILAYLQEHHPETPACPWCGNDDYTVGEVIDLYPRDGGVFGARVFSVFQVICTTCGHTNLFNINIPGLYDTLNDIITKRAESGEGSQSDPESGANP